MRSFSVTKARRFLLGYFVVSTGIFFGMVVHATVKNAAWRAGHMYDAVRPAEVQQDVDRKLNVLGVTGDLLWLGILAIVVAAPVAWWQLRRVRSEQKSPAALRVYAYLPICYALFWVLNWLWYVE